MLKWFLNLPNFKLLFAVVNTCTNRILYFHLSWLCVINTRFLHYPNPLTSFKGNKVVFLIICIVVVHMNAGAQGGKGHWIP